MIEILVCLAITSVLAVTVALSYRPVINAAQSTICVSRLRSLHTGLSANLADSGSWPQPPDSFDEKSLDEWWIKQLAPYDISTKTWLCPTASKIFTNNPTLSNKSSYAVSRFDKSPTAPYKWALQPWLIEIAGVHSGGPHVCFSDGSIKNLNSLLKKNDQGH